MLCGKANFTRTVSTTPREKPTTVVSTTPKTILQTRPTTAIASADMPIGPFPDMPKLLCGEIPDHNRTHR